MNFTNFLKLLNLIANVLQELKHFLHTKESHHLNFQSEYIIS